MWYNTNQNPASGEEMIPRLVIIMILVAFINTVDTLAYGARLAGVRTRSPSLAMSLYNIVALASRTANLIQLPLVASIVDQSLQSGEGDTLLTSFRLLLLSNSAGVLLGILFLPLAVRAFTWGIVRMEKVHSVPLVIIGSLKAENIRKAGQVPFPGVRHLKGVSWRNLPSSFFISNPVLTAFYSVGVLASIYAGYLIPEFRLTASQLSGIVNGVATILLVIIVDPVSALLLDDALKGKRSENELKGAIILLTAGKFTGTLLAQFLLIPAARLIVAITQLIT